MASIEEEPRPQSGTVSGAETGQVLSTPQNTSAWLLLRIWGLIGVQSFGGGPSTILLIRREFVDRRGWLSDEEYSRFWSLCNLAPGINLIALTLLVGRKLAGVKGMVASTCGLILPSALITLILTAGFTSIETLPAVQAMLRGVVPATAGIMLLTGVQFAQPLIRQARREGSISLAVSLVMIALCAATLLFFKVSVLLVLLLTAIAGGFIFTTLQELRAKGSRSGETRRD